MVENLTALFESWGIASAQASSQAEYLTNLPELLDQTWQTVYAPAAATVLAYLIGLPLGILLVTYLLSKYTGLFVIGAVFCALGFLAFFRCRKRSYYIITLALAVGIWCAFRFGLGVSF